MKGHLQNALCILRVGLATVQVCL